MRVPLVVQLAVASQGMPLVAAAVAQRSVRGARTWALGWCLFLLAGDLVGRLPAQHGAPNLWLDYWLVPAGCVLALWTLSFWQQGDVARLTFRIATVPLVLVWVVLTVALEDTSNFSRAAEPTAKLITHGAAAFTLVAGSVRAHGDLLRADWFWVSAGMALYFGASSALGPLSALLVGSDVPLLVRAYEVKAILDILAFVLIARGVTCPTAT